MHHYCRCFLPCFLLIATLLLPTPAVADGHDGGSAKCALGQAEPVPVQEANWELASKWTAGRTLRRLPARTPPPSWLPGTDSDLLWYTRSNHDGLSYQLVDPTARTNQPLLDRMQLAAELTRLTGTPHNPRKLALGSIGLDQSRQVLSFVNGGTAYQYHLADARLVVDEAAAAADIPDYAALAPDRSVYVYRRGNNLFLKAVGDSDELQLTTDGELGYGYGTDQLTDDDPEVPRPAQVLWSPDSRRFCVLRADTRQVGELWLVDHLSRPRPTLNIYKYPMPGEAVAQWQLWVYDRERGEMTRVRTERWPDQDLTDLFGPCQWWSQDGDTLYFTRRSRDYKSVDLCAADPVNGTVRVVIEERLQAMVYLKAPLLLPESGQLLWWSMRDGWGHYYLYREDGTLVRQLTHGPFQVDSVLALDRRARLLYFMARGREPGRNPYYRHLYRIGLDGTGLQLLTPEDGDHQCTISPSQRFLVDTYSRPDLPPQTVVRDHQGKLLLELDKLDISRLLGAGWQAPEVFTAKSADGVTDQWGVMYKPFDFDPDKRYPIVTYVYPGRHSEFIPTRFAPLSSAMILAQLGCIVVHFGNRGGTVERGLWYREYQREQFRDYGLADKKAVIEELADRYSWIDRDRVGIYGGSSGGFMTVSAMLVFPELFKVGVAMSAPNDPSIYFNIWSERYFGVEQVEDEESGQHWRSEAEGNLELADQLQGRLLMINGAADDNVHPAHLMRMADALIKAGKRFDMFLIPGANHSLGSWTYQNGLVFDYFAEHLIGAAPRAGASAFGSQR